MRIATISILSFLMICTSLLFGGVGQQFENKSLANTREGATSLIIAEPDHQLFDAILKAHVSSDGRVDYQEINNNVASLNNYISELQSFPPSSDWSSDAQLAYWINAYNAFTIKLIIDNYPLKSITDLYGGKPWDHNWIEIDGRTLSLNQIENEIIRPTFNEPRIHFAVNCAAKSCPPLSNQAYTADNLDRLLDSRTRAFINEPAYNQIDESPARVSKIFEWYAEDFGDINAFINQYKDAGTPTVTNHTFLEYQWDLNRK